MSEGDKVEWFAGRDMDMAIKNPVVKLDSEGNKVIVSDEFTGMSLKWPIFRESS